MPIFKKQDNTTRLGSSPGSEVCDILDAENGTDALKIEEVTIAPNTRLPRHIHTNTEKAMVVLEGSLDAVVGRERMTIGPGDTVLAPAGTTHGFVNRYDQPARVLFIFPVHEPDEVQSSLDGATSGFLSEAGLSGYSSPHDRPLENQD